MSETHYVTYHSFRYVGPTWVLIAAAIALAAAVFLAIWFWPRKNDDDPRP